MQPVEIAKPEPLLCAICDKPVELETSKTDEQGRAVHEECYVADLTKPLARTILKKLSE